MQYPKKSETVHVETLDDELCIYDWQRKEVHALNPTAALVWQGCDGRTSPAQLAARLEAELNTPHAEELVWMTLDRLEKAHLLEGKVTRPQGAQVMTRRQMLRRLGVAVALLPVIHSVVAPPLAAAQSPIPGPVPIFRPIGEGCSSPTEGYFDPVTASDLQLIEAAGAFCAPQPWMVISFGYPDQGITSCADCQAFAAGADAWRWGETDFGSNCQAMTCGAGTTDDGPREDLFLPDGRPRMLFR